ncbi:MAG: OOP family OmpA-OmpF porin [Polaribacter sp.]|jgi:OOP family OmpA-OmpF porin
MKNLLLPFLFILLCGWIWGGGMMWKSAGCCGGITGLSIMDGTTRVAANGTSNFYFGQSGHQAMALSSVEEDLEKAAIYLKNQSGRQLTVEGRYTSEEENKSAFGNLGLGRANSVISKLIEYGAPAAQLAVGARLMNGLSFSNNKTYEGIGWSFSELIRGISFKDAINNFNNTFADDFQFAKSSVDYSTPISPGLTTTIGKTAEYLNKNGNRSMLVTGYYIDSEVNNSILPNPGQARANAIKKAFTDLGVPGNQINIAGEKSPLDFSRGISPAATYSFADMAAGGDKLTEVETRLRAKSLILYFQTGKNELNLSADQRQYMADLMYYLDNKKGALVTSTGHTDNVGNVGANTTLSLERAEFARDYLTKNNINSAQIKVDGKGPSLPTTTNDTAEGRAKNRRVELTIN